MPRSRRGDGAAARAGTAHDSRRTTDRARLTGTGEGGVPMAQGDERTGMDRDWEELVTAALLGTER
ncbi:hypothetical protein ACFVHW_33755, partial [Streptomyces sp. NPDC127110]|uniref:hypothetical protein n=1 Tax=Streptomyces sp. NPDC127110 TaxID=3345362 RepID=UPI0036409EF7